jgi:tRNA(Ile)-lysidine synthase
LLLALLRGAGVRGLAGMPEIAQLGTGFLVRPLLPFSRNDLMFYAERRGLDWVDDPSNRDLNLDRNWLRARLLPMLAERWPAVDRALSRSAGHCAEAADLVERLAAGEIGRLRGRRPGTLSVAGLSALDPPLCRAVLRHWIGDLGLPTPQARHLARVMGEVLTARVDASPLVAWLGCEIRRYRDDLFALMPLPLDPAGGELAWTRGLLDLPAGLGQLCLHDGAGHRMDPEKLCGGPRKVRFGVAGLRCRPVCGARHRHLKQLYQEAGIPPWLRCYVPLVFVKDRLLSVGDFWICASEDSGDHADLRLVWSGHPWPWLQPTKEL